MTPENDCKNCMHAKEIHRLVLGRSEEGGDFLPGTSMPSGKLQSKIICTKCSCEEYIPMRESEDNDHSRNP